MLTQKNIFLLRALSTFVVTMVIIPAAAQQTPPAAFNGSYKANYVRSWDAVRPETNASNLTISSALEDARITTQYLDGLGRPIETVVKQGAKVSGSPAVDMVSAKVYDNYGREKYQYLPFGANSTGGYTTNDGSFKLNPFQQQAVFYASSTTGSPLFGQTETWFYGQTDMEVSTLNRVEKSMAPGNSWTGAGRGMEIKYTSNTTIDEVRMWVVTEVTGSFGTYGTTTTYPAGLLHKTITTDENGKQVIEFKDKSGKVILKKVQLTAANDTGTGSAHLNWLCTYYVYDDLDQLRGVIQPDAVKNLPGSGWALNSTLYSQQCFRYEYDSRGRMIRKKVPAADEVYMVYDKRDRLVMSQDANLRGVNKWMVSLYDELNRPLQTGLVLNTWSGGGSKTFAQHLAAAEISIAYPFTVSSTPAITHWEYLSKTGYDDYSAIPGASGLNNTFDNTWSAKFTSTYNTAPLYAQQQAPSGNTKGMVTWTETKVLETSTYLYSVSIYDEKGRVIQVKAKNITGGTDVITSQYNWAGQPLTVVQKQEKAGSPTNVNTVTTTILYDALSRIEKIKKTVSSNVNGTVINHPEVNVITNKYDALGQLSNKEVGVKKDANNNYTTTPVEILKYDYNVRGWMLGMNREYLSGTGTARFGFELAYDKKKSFFDGLSADTYIKVQYNGNIGGTIWRSAGDGEKRKYDFDYDAANRLLKADFTQNNSGWNTTAGVDFSVGGSTGSTITYSDNGDILQMGHKGLTLTGSDWIDKMTYTYNAGNTRLLKVQETATHASNGKLGDFSDGTNGSNNDYTYDVNGNLTTDLNKAISSITYNHLNLPKVITVTGKGTITYTYDATGVKQKKVTAETGATVNYNGTPYSTTITTTTTYQAGAVYETKIYSNGALTALNYTDRLQFLSHEEGRIRFKFETNTLHYDYFIKDHLGNVRMVLTDELKKDKYPVASMETAKVNTEDDYYNIDPSKIVLGSTVTGLPTYTNDNGIGNNPTDVPFETANSQKLYKLNGGSGGNKLGLGITLKVMAGDKIDIHGRSYYFQNNSGGVGANTAPQLVDILNAFLGGPTGSVASSAHGGVTGTQLSGYSGTTGGISTLLGNQTTAASAAPLVPKAHINYLFFDEQFKCVGYGSSKVGSNSTIKNHFSELQNLTVPRNGYVYIYCSNESPVDVFFDNLQAVHTRGEIIEETHYYPFGLTMSGISSKALKDDNYPENNRKYNGIEKVDDFGLEIYDAQFRELDGQTGRWWQIDPKTENMEMWSPYVSNYDSPIKYSDPLGDEGQECCWFTFDKEAFLDGIQWINDNMNPFTPVVEFVTGKSSESHFTESKPRLVTLQQAMNPVPLKMKGPSGTLSKVEQLKINAGKGVLSEKKVLAEEGLKKNTTPITVTDPKTGKEVTTIPDANKPNGSTVDVKDVKKLSDSKQLRAQSAASAKSGQKATVITGTNTKVSSTVENRMKVERKDNIGPQN